jgi:hypothetical protein
LVRTAQSVYGQKNRAGQERGKDRGEQRHQRIGQRIDREIPEMIHTHVMYIDEETR